MRSILLLSVALAFLAMPGSAEAMAAQGNYLGGI